MSGDNTTSSRGGSNLFRLMDCDAGVSIDDLVYLHPTATNEAVLASDNNTPTPVIGVVVQKPTATQCLVLLRGPLTKTVTQGKLFVGTDGKFTTSVPLTGYIQLLGNSFGDGTLDLLPNQQRTKRS